MTAAAAFFEQDADRYVSTPLTRGPWDADFQHGGPPAALLGRAIEQLPDGDGMQVTRVTLEILRPVPITTLGIRATVVRPGRRVQLCEAVLSADDQELVRVSAWRMRTEAVGMPDGVGQASPPPGPETGTEQPFFPSGQDVGYHTAMAVRFIQGGFVDPGPATVWMRMRYPLVAGEEPSPLQRVLVAADSGNGVSAALDYRRWVFVNPDLTVALHRLPLGEWVCLDAQTTAEPHGVGLAHAILSDQHGRIGYGLQTLFVAPR